MNSMTEPGSDQTTGVAQPGWRTGQKPGHPAHGTQIVGKIRMAHARGQ